MSTQTQQVHEEIIIPTERVRVNLTEEEQKKVRNQYEDFLRHVWVNGTPKTDRTGTGTRSVFGYQMRFDMADGFPLITTKKVHLKSILYETLWFLMGGRNNKWLNERGVTIWDEWAGPDGDLGPVYGVQWRNWPTPGGGHVDQLAEAIRTIRENPDSRRIIVSSWNVADIPAMALAPCHAFFQFYVADSKLSLQLYQRSADSFLGVPFNIASYALLLLMVATLCDLEPHEFIWTGGDCHIYNNHFRQTQAQLMRDPYPYPKMVIKRKPASIDGFRYEDFELVGYRSHPHIPAKVSK